MDNDDISPKMQLREKYISQLLLVVKEYWSVSLVIEDDLLQRKWENNYGSGYQKVCRNLTMEVVEAT